MQIGNAVINDETDIQGMVDYAWSHAIISDKVYHSFRRACIGSAGNDSSEACDSAMKAFMRGYDGIDIYSIYTPVCLSSLSRRPAPKTNPRGGAAAPHVRPPPPLALLAHSAQPSQ